MHLLTYTAQQQTAYQTAANCRQTCNLLLLVGLSPGNVLLVKGAAECILERCDRMMLPDGKVVQLTPTARTAILETVDTMADSALRILAMARK